MTWSKDWKKGDIIWDSINKNDIMEYLGETDSTDFSAQTIKSDYYETDYISRTWTKQYKGWSLLPAYNTPLWKALNGRD